MKQKRKDSQERLKKGLLVGVFVFVVGGLLVTLSNNFLQMQTSTDTKAKKNKLKTVQTNKSESMSNADAFVSCTKTPLSGSDYYPGADYCGKINFTCPSGGIIDQTNLAAFCGVGTYCCRKGDLSKLGTTYCESQKKGFNGECGFSSATISGKSKSSTSCQFAQKDNLVGTFLGTGSCFYSSTASSPAPSRQAPPTELTNCGFANTNCQAVWNTNTDTVKFGKTMECAKLLDGNGNVTDAYCGYAMSPDTSCKDVRAYLRATCYAYSYQAGSNLGTACITKVKVLNTGMGPSGTPIDRKKVCLGI